MDEGTHPSVDVGGGISGATGSVVSRGSGTVVTKRISLQERATAHKGLVEMCFGLAVPPDSKHLCPVLNTSRRTSRMELSMPRLACDLVDLVNHSPGLCVRRGTARAILSDVCEGLVELRDMLGPECCHGDLKLDNVMLHVPQEGSPRCVLIDFGHSRSRRFSDYRARRCPWRGFEKSEAGILSDMWSVGILALQILSPACRRALSDGQRARTMAVVARITDTLPPRQLRVRGLSAQMRSSRVTLARDEFLAKAGDEDLVSACRAMLAWLPDARPDPAELAQRLARGKNWRLPNKILSLPCAPSLATEADEFQSPVDRSVKREVRRVFDAALGSPCHRYAPQNPLPTFLRLGDFIQNRGCEILRARGWPFLSQ